MDFDLPALLAQRADRSHVGLIHASLLLDHCRRAGNVETAVAQAVGNEDHNVAQRAIISHHKIVTDYCACVRLRTARIGGHVDASVRGGGTFKTDSAHQRRIA